MKLPLSTLSGFLHIGWTRTLCCLPLCFATSLLRQQMLFVLLARMRGWFLKWDVNDRVCSLCVTFVPLLQPLEDVPCHRMLQWNTFISCHYIITLQQIMIVGCNGKHISQMVWSWTAYWSPHSFCLSFTSLTFLFCVGIYLMIWSFSGLVLF